MLGEELVEQTVVLLSTAIGMIMEDHVGQAIQTGPSGAAYRTAELIQAGVDIASLAGAAEVFARRRNG